MNAKCNDFSVCSEFLYIFAGQIALGLFFLVFSPLFKQLAGVDNCC
jgi:hypothetical protein